MHSKLQRRKASCAVIAFFASIVAWLCISQVRRGHRVSLVAACKLSKSRSSNFERALQSWLRVRGLSRIIIVDWQSEVPVKSILHNSRVDRVRIVVKEITNTPALDWRIGPAVNLALEDVTTGITLKVDCDTLLHPDFLVHNSLSTVGFRYGDYRNAIKDRNDNHLNGVFMAFTAHLRDVHAFDERLSLYGWDDSDLYLRLESHIKQIQGVYPTGDVYADFIRNKGDTRLIQHLPHERGAETSFEIVGICFNREAVKHVQHWERSPDRYRCRCVDIDHFGYFQLKKCYIDVAARKIEEVLGVGACERLAEGCVEGYNGNKKDITRICS